MDHITGGDSKIGWERVARGKTGCRDREGSEGLLNLITRCGTDGRISPPFCFNEHGSIGAQGLNAEKKGLFKAKEANDSL